MVNRRDFIRGLLVTTALLAVPKPVLVATETPLYRVSFDELAKITLARYRPILADLMMRQSVVYSVLRGNS